MAVQHHDYHRRVTDDEWCDEWFILYVTGLTEYQKCTQTYIALYHIIHWFCDDVDIIRR